MGRKGVEDMISEIEIFVDSCKYQTLSSTKIIVPKDEIETMLSELKLKMPSEIERCKKIMRNKEAILSDARTRADGIITEAVNEANRLVSEDQIVELANIRAGEIIETARIEAGKILDDATNEANEIRLGSMLYTKDMLNNIDNFISNTLEAERANFSHLIESLQNNKDVILTNVYEIDNQIKDFTGESQREEEKRAARQAEVVAAAEQQMNAINAESVYGDSNYSIDNYEDADGQEQVNAAEDDYYSDGFLDD